MVFIILDGREYNLDEKMVAAMEYISKAEAIEEGQNVNSMLLLRLPLLISTKRLLS